jgi:hypothetical protein
LLEHGDHHAPVWRPPDGYKVKSINEVTPRFLDEFKAWLEQHPPSIPLVQV